jgi:hypothetical protein
MSDDIDDAKLAAFVDALATHASEFARKVGR